jgi:hypothetical protein
MATPGAPLFRTRSGRYVLGALLPEDKSLVKRASLALGLSTLASVLGIVAAVLSFLTPLLQYSLALAFLSAVIAPVLALMGVRCRSRPFCVAAACVNALCVVLFSLGPAVAGGARAPRALAPPPPHPSLSSIFAASLRPAAAAATPRAALVASLTFAALFAVTEVATVVALVRLVAHPLFAAGARFQGPRGAEPVQPGLTVHGGAAPPV